MIKERFNKQIRASIRQAITTSGMSQKKIAEACGIHRANLTKYLKHERDCISDKKLTELMRYLKIY